MNSKDELLKKLAEFDEQLAINKAIIESNDNDIAEIDLKLSQVNF